MPAIILSYNKILQQIIQQIGVQIKNYALQYYLTELNFQILDKINNNLQIKYMYQYLLSVAQKIIDASVPLKISSKYYELKKSLMLKSASLAQKQNYNHKLYQTPTVKLAQPIQSKTNFISTNDQIHDRIYAPFNSFATELKQRKIQSNTFNIFEQTSQIKTIKQKTQMESIQRKELLTDNKWLIQQVDKLIKQNNILKKMIQRKS